jgi:hypothetical protein
MDALLKKTIPKTDGLSCAVRRSFLGDSAAGPTDWRRRQGRSRFAGLHRLYAMDLMSFDVPSR